MKAWPKASALSPACGKRLSIFVENGHPSVLDEHRSLRACHPSMTTSGPVKCSRSGRIRPAGNAVQRAAQTPSLSPLPQEVLLLGLGLGLLLFLLFCFMTLELAGY